MKNRLPLSIALPKLIIAVAFENMDLEHLILDHSCVSCFKNYIKNNNERV